MSDISGSDLHIIHALTLAIPILLIINCYSLWILHRYARPHLYITCIIISLLRCFNFSIFTFINVSRQLRLAKISASKLVCLSILDCKLIGSLQLSSWATVFFSFSHDDSWARNQSWTSVGLQSRIEYQTFIHSRQMIIKHIHNHSNHPSDILYLITTLEEFV